MTASFSVSGGASVAGWETGREEVKMGRRRCVRLASGRRGAMYSILSSSAFKVRNMGNIRISSRVSVLGLEVDEIEERKAVAGHLWSELSSSMWLC